MYRWVATIEGMLRLIFLAGGISAVVSMTTNECSLREEYSRFRLGCFSCVCHNGEPVCTRKYCYDEDVCVGKKENYTFKQGCNECWCVNEKAYCTNIGCAFANDEDDYEDDNTNGETMRLRNANAIGTQAWDLGSKFPKKYSKERRPVTPYPPSFRRRYHLHRVPEPSDVQKYPKMLEYRRPDAGGLNVLDEKYIMYPHAFRRSRLYPRAHLRYVRYPGVPQAVQLQPPPYFSQPIVYGPYWNEMKRRG